jgi:AraC-like DNA-binding protein
MPDDPFFRHVRRAPTGQIAELARETWSVEAERCRMAAEAVLPDASVEVYFNLGPAGRHLTGETARSHLPHRAAWVVGAHDRPLYVEKETRDCDIVAIRLHPWTAERVLGVPAREIAGSMLDLELFWKSAVDDIRNELSATTDPRARLAIVERGVARQAALRRRPDDGPLGRALCDAAESDAGASIGDLAARFGLTHRRVIGVFDRAVGLKPKTYQRVRRLRHVLRLVDESPRPTWTAIAHRCGYFDQAHLINDFRLLTGISPGHYESTRSSVGHGFVPHRLASVTTT